MSEILIKRGRLAEIKQRKLELAAKIKANLKACAMCLANYRIDTVDKIDVDSVAINAMEAKTLKAEYTETVKNIGLLSEELGE
jgi:hypothetical protein